MLASEVPDLRYFMDLGINWLRKVIAIIVGTIIVGTIIVGTIIVGTVVVGTIVVEDTDSITAEKYYADKGIDITSEDFNSADNNSGSTDDSSDDGSYDDISGCIDHVQVCVNGHIQEVGSCGWSDIHGHDLVELLFQVVKSEYTGANV